MNILILTGQFGMGHVVAAQAIEQEILRRCGGGHCRALCAPAAPPGIRLL